MAGPDALQRFVFERARVRGELVILTETWRGMHVTCELCGQRYPVSPEEAERALADAAGKTPARAV